jgi:hypothetical protein
MEKEAPTRTQSALHRSSAREIKSVVEAEAAGLPFLVWRDGRDAQRILTLDTRRRLTIGRRSSNDIVLDDGEVSRVHAELEPIAADWAVIDLGLSRNGTFIGRERILGRRRLNDRDELRFGRTVITYRRSRAGASVATSVANSPPELTDTQRAILVALARPYKVSDRRFVVPASNAAVAKEVCLGLDAVKGHLTVLYKRFELDRCAQNEKRARLVACALEWGLVSERDL